MGGFFGAAGKESVMSDVFYGTDYHSHLGTKRAGMAAYDKEIGLQRVIRNIENSPFKTKFENIFNEMQGTSALGVISDIFPQPLLIRSAIGSYAISVTGSINNAEELTKNCLEHSGAHFDAMTGGKVNATELVAELIDQKKDFVEGIKYVQEVVEGSATIIILKDDGHIIAARDKFGRLPIIVASKENAKCVSFESFVCQKLGYEFEKELGPGEIVEISADECKQLAAPGDDLKICAFLWSYYGYPTATYEGMNVEMMRYRNGQNMAKQDLELGHSMDINFVAGVPDSGTPHAIGYANEAGKHFARPFIKYTPTWSRSFIPSTQDDRNKVAKMKQVPVPDLIKDKKLLLIDDSIVRGTQLRETVDFLYESGAKEIHMRSACPPIMYTCKYLQFTRVKSEMELIARRVILKLEGEEGFNYIEEYSDPFTERGKALREEIRSQLKLTSLEFQSLKGVLDAIGLDPSKLCTYCWNGKG